MLIVEESKDIYQVNMSNSCFQFLKREDLLVLCICVSSGIGLLVGQHQQSEDVTRGFWEIALAVFFTKICTNQNNNKQRNENNKIQFIVSFKVT